MPTRWCTCMCVLYKCRHQRSSELDVFQSSQTKPRQDSVYIDRHNTSSAENRSIRAGIGICSLELCGRSLESFRTPWWRTHPSWSYKFHLQTKLLWIEADQGHNYEEHYPSMLMPSWCTISSSLFSTTETPFSLASISFALNNYNRFSTQQLVYWPIYRVSHIYRIKYDMIYMGCHIMLTTYATRSL